MPLLWAVIEARALLPGAPPTDGMAAKATLLLAGSVGLAFLARMRWRLVVCEGMGVLALPQGRRCSRLTVPYLKLLNADTSDLYRPGRLAHGAESRIDVLPPLYHVGGVAGRAGR